MSPAGSPRSVPNRANASNGEVVNTPPKSQITASIMLPRLWPVPARQRLTRNADRDQSEPPLGEACRNGYFCGMKFPISIMAGLLLAASPAYAIVGGAAAGGGGGPSPVQLVRSRGH